MELKGHFSRFLGADPGRLHMAAHSHHPWPDVSFEAHQEAWLDAARLIDDKWDKIFAEVLPEAAGHVARRLGLSDPATVAFGPNTHSLIVRLLSCLPGLYGGDPRAPGPPRILTTDAEFHSFARQARRLEEDGLAVVERVAAEPFSSFPDRFRHAAAGGGHDLVFFSHVHFNSAYVMPALEAVVAAVPSTDAVVVIDGYHGFMACPTDLGSLERRVFYTAGGYKYAMTGEGAGFLHCPPGYARRPVDTGWYAGFSDLAAAGRPGDVTFGTDASRFLGATFDPTAIYRFNAVQRWLDDLGLSVADIHAHVAHLQKIFLDRLDDRWRAALVPPIDVVERGHFLVFRFPEAEVLRQRLHDRGVITDHRDDRLRVGFGVYHNERDIEEFCRRLELAGRN